MKTHEQLTVLGVEQMMDSAILSDSAYEIVRATSPTCPRLPSRGLGPRVFDGNRCRLPSCWTALAIGNKELCRMATLGSLRRRGCATRSSEARQPSI